jgi:hypothetical protein
MLSPTLSKKNSVISSRTSSIVDLSELDYSNQSNNPNNLNIKHFDEDVHFVESDINEESNYNKKRYFYFVKKWFGS